MHTISLPISMSGTQLACKLVLQRFKSSVWAITRSLTARVTTRLYLGFSVGIGIGIGIEPR
jgi:hypothetical protein